LKQEKLQDSQTKSTKPTTLTKNTPENAKQQYIDKDESEEELDRFVILFIGTTFATNVSFILVVLL